MLTPDLDLARRFIAAHPPPGRLLLCGITGAHHYGFPSPDSDIDMKGIHLAPTRALLGLDTPPETHDRLQIFEGAECDLTSHEAAKALALLLAGNGNMLERILAPLQLIEGEEVTELRALARASVSKRFAGHYRGFFRGMCREHQSRSEPRAKSMLYSYRVALTGIHLMRTGELEADIRRLAPIYGFDSIGEVVAFKRDHGEKSPLPDDLDHRHRVGWKTLAEALEAAVAESALPLEAPNRESIGEWLISLRLGETGIAN